MTTRLTREQVNFTFSKDLPPIARVKPGEEVIFETQDGLLKLSASDTDLGDALEEMEIEDFSENITIAFDSKLVIEILSHIDSEIVVLNLKGPFDPAIIKPFDDESHLCLIAPMRQG